MAASAGAVISNACIEEGQSWDEIEVNMFILNVYGCFDMVIFIQEKEDPLPLDWTNDPFPVCVRCPSHLNYICF